MRHLKSILFLTVLCLLLSLCPTGIAEEEIISAPVDLEVGEAEQLEGAELVVVAQAYFQAEVAVSACLWLALLLDFCSHLVERHV